MRRAEPIAESQTENTPNTNISRRRNTMKKILFALSAIAIVATMLVGTAMNTYAATCEKSGTQYHCGIPR